VTHSQPLTHQNVVRFAKSLGHVAPRVVAAPSGLHAFISRLSAMAKLSAEELLLLQGLRGVVARIRLIASQAGPT